MKYAFMLPNAFREAHAGALLRRGPLSSGEPAAHLGGLGGEANQKFFGGLLADPMLARAEFNPLLTIELLYPNTSIQLTHFFSAFIPFTFRTFHLPIPHLFICLFQFSAKPLNRLRRIHKHNRTKRSPTYGHSF